MATNPIMIAYARNPAMKCWDVMVQVGNCRTEQEAKDIARKIKEYLEREGGATMERVQ